MSNNKAPSFALPVPVGGAAVMFVSDPRHDPHIEWSLRYAQNLNDSHAGRFSAAAIVESFDYLLSSNINMAEATRRLRLLRAAVRELPTHDSGVNPSSNDQQEADRG
jgi:hypothetical protein